MGVGLARPSALVAGQFHFLAVADEIGWIEGVGVYLVVVSEEDVESVLFRHAGGVTSTGTPFPETSGGVAFLLEEGSDGGFVGTQGRAAVVGTDRGMSSVLAGHQVAAQGCADRGGGKGVGEADAVLRHAVNTGSLEVGASHMSELVVGELIGHDIDDVGQSGRSVDGEKEAGGEEA